MQSPKRKWNIFSPRLRESPDGVFRLVSMPGEIFPGAIVTISFLPAAFYGNRIYIGLAVFAVLMTAIRLFRVRRFAQGGIPLAAIEGGTLTFLSQDLWRQFKQFPVAEIEQVRVHGAPAHRFFSFKLAGQPEKVFAPAFGGEAAQAIANFLQTALPEKVLVERGRSVPPPSEKVS